MKIDLKSLKHFGTFIILNVKNRAEINPNVPRFRVFRSQTVSSGS